MTSHVSAEQSANSLPLSWQRLLALSGVAFAVLFLVGWFASGGDAPDYGASDQDWTNWADDNQWKSRIGAFAMLLAGFVFLHFAATIRTALGDAEARAGGSAQLARVAFAGAITGMAGMVMAIVIISSRDDRGCRRQSGRDSCDREFLGRAFPALRDGLRCLPDGGRSPDTPKRSLRTLDRHRGAHRRGLVSSSRSDRFSRATDDSLFGFGFFPGVLALVIWSIATSVARYRALSAEPMR